MNIKKTPIRQLQKLSTVALGWGLVLLILSVRTRWLVWHSNPSAGLVLTCLSGPVSLFLTGFLIIFVFALVFLTIRFIRQNRIEEVRKDLIVNWSLLASTLLSVCFIPLSTLLIDKYFQARQPDRSPTFVSRIEGDFNLASVLPEYDRVIEAIEQYYEEWEQYPADLSDLVPDYLTEVPSIYIRNGERLTYKPEPMYENTPPYTFSIYGHYPGLAYMHGWTLYYCPASYEGCSDDGNSYRINQNWLWIHNPAL